MLPEGFETWPQELQAKVKQEQKHAEYDVESLRQEAIASLPKNHHWIKSGVHAICNSCEIQHSVYIGHQLLKVDEQGNYYLEQMRMRPR